ncbi:MAG: histidine kinase [Micrococcales bacterium]|nr:MAG: histidine kinase [Micrococcales bacterium]PIE27057.1 MAG: histidine kinase [Micrococcales bacterium]
MTPPLTPQPGYALVRPGEGRMIGGVCAGLAEHFAVPVVAVRLVFVLAALFASGLGAILYGVLWALVPQESRLQDPVAGHVQTLDGPPLSGLRAGDQEQLRRRAEAARGQELRRALVAGLVLVAVGVVWLADRSSLSFDTRWLLPLLILAVGVAIGLTQLDDVENSRLLGTLAPARWTGVLRLAVGAALAVTGMLLMALPEIEPGQVTTLLVAVLVVVAGLGVVAAPWALRVWRDLEAERSLRAREAERAEIAAHLHDSVLQTLALIQRRPDDPVAVARLARAQERELRQWLYGAPGTAEQGGDSVAKEVRRICAEAEDAEGVAVQVIVVGDIAVDEATGALLQALREAVSNAVRHGRVGVSVYVECTQDSVEAFVRDRGPGIDVAAIPEDRFGVRGSIIDRMKRHGGHAGVRAAPGGGTEVALRIDAVRPGNSTGADPMAHNHETSPVGRDQQ